MAVHSGDREHWNRIALITALAERHYGNYALYCDLTGQQELAEQWRKNLNKVWEYLAGQLNSMKNLEKALLSMDELTPEPDEEDGYGVYPAQDACLLLTSALQMILDNSIDDVETACGLSLQTVAQFVAFSQELELDDAMDNPQVQQHPLYQQEVDLQQYLDGFLQQSRDPSELIKELRRELRDYDCSNLGIELPPQ
ncbi:DUF416 family protein [Pseudomaricurvus sp. HS19]|uniref:DUF416 family protein n=1 Tax=Pseudomaricurvus sp. HS19 TaxID=2692626 RepID=UPI00136E76F2|nr:DUF416 family protein [Pseudomaricurvus sp. HS19]MYM62671.1 DUF416 family protein [Pseudomaricurvus sp. HS19]